MESLRVGLGAEARGVWGSYRCGSGLGLGDSELFLVGGFVVVAWAWTCGGRAEGGGGDGGVPLAVSLVEGAAVVTPPAATAAAREELGGEANGADWFVTGGVGVAPCAGVLAGVV